MLKPILLVEDDPKDLELTLIALEKNQRANEVVNARDGDEALDYLLCGGRHSDRASSNPAVILLDLKLPKDDGIKGLQRARATTSLKSIPEVMLTSSRDEKDLLRRYEFGANAYVVKPVAFRDFVEAIRDLGVFWAVVDEPPPGSARIARKGNPL